MNSRIPQQRFILKGFSQEQGIRRFLFEGIEEDHGRSQFTVHADLNLARIYGIHLQDLPLLCRELLERRADSEAVRRLVFTEEEMRQHRADRVAAQEVAAQKRKTPRRRPSENLGMVWRNPGVLGERSGA